MRRIIKAQIVGNFFHGNIGKSCLPFCFQHNPLLNMMTCRKSGYLFHHFIEIAGRYYQFLRIIRYHSLLRIILFQQGKEFAHQFNTP